MIGKVLKFFFPRQWREAVLREIADTEAHIKRQRELIDGMREQLKGIGSVLSDPKFLEIYTKIFKDNPYDFLARLENCLKDSEASLRKWEQHIVDLKATIKE